MQPSDWKATTEVEIYTVENTVAEALFINTVVTLCRSISAIVSNLTAQIPRNFMVLFTL